MQLMSRVDYRDKGLQPLVSHARETGPNDRVYHMPRRGRQACGLREPLAIVMIVLLCGFS